MTDDKNDLAEKLLDDPAKQIIEYGLASDALTPFLAYYKEYSDLIVKKYRENTKDLSTSADVIKVQVIVFGDFMAWLQARMKEERNQV